MTAATGPPPIRIAHLVFGMGVGGLENGLLNLVSRLPRETFEHAIYCIKVLGPNAERARRAGAHVELVGRPDTRNRLLIPRLAARFARRRPHIVHTRNFGTIDGVIAARLALVPAVVHGEHGWDTADMQGRSARRRRIRRMLEPCVTRYVAVSEDIAAWLRGHGGRFAGKVTTIRNGVDLDRFRRAGREPGSDAVFTIGTIGRLAPVKDQASLIGAFADLAEAFPRARLLIVGGGELDEELRCQAAATPCAGRIRFTGEIEDVAVTLRELDLFVLPSLNEGISNTILEAMALGLPVVASAVGGNPELVVEGETGSLVPPARPEALSRVLRVYLEHPGLAHEHGRRGRERAERLFSLQGMVDAYADLYREVLPRRLARRLGL